MVHGLREGQSVNHSHYCFLDESSGHLPPSHSLLVHASRFVFPSTPVAFPIHYYLKLSFSVIHTTRYPLPVSLSTHADGDHHTPPTSLLYNAVEDTIYKNLTKQVAEITLQLWFELRLTHFYCCRFADVIWQKPRTR
ncbi:unnamed protein product [Lactuca virosa]|uniref:Uncharacterized protein n=1 Tax=Lactuca virosa TaxID=75947 RepID=A0AAU9NMR1_9ASTR|nr:unnamed protein product [Lactuca virosa]